MKLARLSLLAAVLTLGASATDVSGTWKGVFTEPKDQWPKTVGGMTFEITSDGTTLAGTAQVGSWPGKAPITDGKIEGNRISFTMTGDGAWRSSGPMGSFSGYPRLKFSGTVEGDEMKLTLVWDSIMIYGDPPAPRIWHVQGRRVSP
jgi:hypothetical protein